MNHGITQIPLKVNCYKIDFNKNAEITLYSLRYVPNIDDKKIKSIRKLFLRERESLNAIFQNFFLISGTQLAAILKPNIKVPEKIVCNRTGIIFELTPNIKDEIIIPDFQRILLTNNKIILYGDALLPKTAENNRLAFTILNQIITNTLLERKYAMLGKSSKYFDFSSPSIQMGPYSIYQGLRKAIQCTITNPIIRIDYCTRIFSDSNLLTSMVKSRQQTASLEAFKSSFINKRVMTKYGQKGRFYRIDDIIMDLTPSTHKITVLVNNEEVSMNLIEYYNHKYGIKIKEKNQPLIKYITNKQKRMLAQPGKPPKISKERAYDIYLVPELCYDVELPEDFFSNRFGESNEINMYTKPEPAARYDLIMKSLKPLQDAQKALKEKGIKIDNQMIDVIGKEIPVYLNVLKESQQSPLRVENCSFKYRYISPFSNLKGISQDEWMIVYDQRNSETVEDFIGSLLHCAEERRINMQPPTKVACAINEPSLEMVSRVILENAQHCFKKDRTKVIIYVLPLMKKLKEPYKFIKAKMYKFGIMSQVVLLYTINKRKDAINDKILLKIMMRFGADLWRLNISPSLLMPKKIMIVGIESANQSAVTYVSSYNQFCSKFYVQIVKSEVKIDAHRRLLNLAPYFKRSLSIFKASASSYPDLVIIYRKGKSEEECITFIGQEIASIEEEIKNVQTTEKVGNIPLVFLTYNTRSSLRAFQFDSYAVQNPREAILIEDEHIIPKAEQVGISYEFFLKPQNCTVGSSNFTHYRVHRLPNEIKSTTLAEFTLCQCFGYFGFTGGIRIPAICQYAKRAAEKYALTEQEPSVDISKEKYAY